MVKFTKVIWLTEPAVNLPIWPKMNLVLSSFLDAFVGKNGVNKHCFKMGLIVSYAKVTCWCRSSLGYLVLNDFSKPKSRWRRGSAEGMGAIKRILPTYTERMEGAAALLAMKFTHSQKLFGSVTKVRTCSLPSCTY